MPEINMTPLVGRVTATARLNVRIGKPGTSAPIRSRLEPGESIAVRGIVRGETVHGNADWYAGLEDTFVWTGACGTFQPDGVLGAAPLAVNRRQNGTIRPLDDANLRRVFGDIQPTEAAGGRVLLADAWQQANITSISPRVLQALGIPQVEVHVKARDAFMAAFAAVDAANLADRLLTFGGTFVPRHKGWNSQRTLSSHTWGVAVDLNVAWNGYGAEPAGLGMHGSLRELVPIFEGLGFAWGGYFEPSSACDGMHFELARLDL